MEIYEIIAICIGIAAASFSLMAIASILYCIFMSCQSLVTPRPAPAFSGTTPTEKSTCDSNPFPRALTEKVDRNIAMASAPTYV